MKGLLAAAFAALAYLLSAIAAAPVGASTVRLDAPGDNPLAEADIALDPTNPQRMFVVAKSVGLVYRTLDAYRSTDGGARFTGGPAVNGSYLAAPADASDPVAAFDSGGRAFFGQLAWRYAGSRGFESWIGVERSIDAGASFGAPVPAVRTYNAKRPRTYTSIPRPSTTNDKPAIAIDRSGGSRDGDVYVAFNQVRLGARGPAHIVMQVSRSTDHGASFSRPMSLSSPRFQALNPQLAVGARGKLYAMWSSQTRIGRKPAVVVFEAVSQDGARSFSAPSMVARFYPGPSMPSFTSEATNLNVSLAASQSGVVVACFVQVAGRTACKRSSGGRFGAAVAVANGLGGVQALPRVVADERGRFWLTMYRLGRSSTSVNLYRSDNAGVSFAPVKTLASKSFRVSSFVGDYSGLAVGGGTVAAAYVLPRAGADSLTSIYVDVLSAP